MGRDSDRSVHPLPRGLARRRRGRATAQVPLPQCAGARISRGGKRCDAEVTDPKITPELVREHNLTTEEYARITAMLGREPTFPELGIFSALWSEHCSYKHSRPVLKTFPTTGAQVVQGPGENAGVLRLPNGWAVAFKIESHNHPSAVEPYQGAAALCPRPNGRARRFQNRVAQPSVGRRAISGRGDGGRRHSARRIHHGRSEERRVGKECRSRW